MVWGWEVVNGFNPYTFSAINIISQMIFLFLFAYISARGDKEKPIDIALEVTGYTMLVEFFLIFFGLPPLIVAILFVAGYLIVARYVLKLHSLTEFTVFTGFIIYFFALITILDDLTRGWFLTFVLVLYFFISEIRLKVKKVEAPKAEAPKKAGA